MTQPPELNRRARRILQAVVSEYLHGGDAVGSRTITRRHDIGLSPATVRNVMADLEELGLLEQRHTSAGRVPTESGLRFFIDSLLKVRGLSPREKDEIRAQIIAPTPDEVLGRASRLLSEITSHAAVILAPDPALQRLSRVEFVPLRQGKVLCILVTAEGRIENRLVAFDEAIEGGRLDRVHNYLNSLITGLTVDEVRDRVLAELGEEKNRYDLEVSAALRLGQAAFSSGRPADVMVSGHSNLVDVGSAGDLARVDRMRELLRTLEDKQLLLRLLDQTRTAEGIHVFLGAETAVAALAESSVVGVAYGPEERPIGALAVIGPMRMNYGKVMSVVDFTADLVSQILSDL